MSHATVAWKSKRREMATTIIARGHRIILRRPLPFSIERMTRDVDCHGCWKTVKIQWRYLDVVVCRQLGWLVQAARKSTRKGRWIHRKDNPRWMHIHGTRYTQLKHWGLVERRPNHKRPGRMMQGWWRPTAKGVLFTMNRLRVPEVVVVYNDQKIGASTWMMRVKDVVRFWDPEEYSMMGYMYLELVEWESLKGKRVRRHGGVHLPPDDEDDDDLGEEE